MLLEAKYLNLNVAELTWQEQTESIGLQAQFDALPSAKAVPPQYGPVHAEHCLVAVGSTVLVQAALTVHSPCA